MSVVAEYPGWCYAHRKWCGADAVVRRRHGHSFNPKKRIPCPCCQQPVTDTRASWPRVAHGPIPILAARIEPKTYYSAPWIVNLYRERDRDDYTVTYIAQPPPTAIDDAARADIAFLLMHGYDVDISEFGLHPGPTLRIAIVAPENENEVRRAVRKAALDAAKATAPRRLTARERGVAFRPSRFDLMRKA